MIKYLGKKDSVVPKKSTLLESSLPNSKTNLNDIGQVVNTSTINDNDEELTDMPQRKKKKHLMKF